MYNYHTVSAVIVAGGSSRRMGFDKLCFVIKGKSVLQRSIEAFAKCEAIDEIIVVTNTHTELVQKYSQQCTKKLICVSGGEQRINSAQNGARAASCEYIAIHDAARPFVSENVIMRTLQAAILHGAAAPCVPVSDTIKQVSKDMSVLNTPPRASLFAVQTPQIFQKQEYLQASSKINIQELTDDCSIYEQCGKKVVLVEGEYQNNKITTPEDIKELTQMRIGNGYDVHKLVENRALILGGVKIPYEKGLLGHSDADVLCHAIMDAMLGGAALGDIGKLFPDTSAEFKGADSVLLLQKVNETLAQNGYCVNNIDATILCENPKLRRFIDEMRAKIANAIGVNISQVSVKATTEEGLGFTGSGEGIAVHAVVLLQRI